MKKRLPFPLLPVLLVLLLFFCSCGREASLPETETVSGDEETASQAETLPVYSVGRGAKKGIAGAMVELGGAAKPPRSLWHALGFAIFAGNFVLMIYYTDVAGWLVKYTGDYLVGRTTSFPDLVADKPTSAAYMAGTVALAAAICHGHSAKGREMLKGRLK